MAQEHDGRAAARPPLRSALDVITPDGVILRPEELPACDRTPAQIAALLHRPFPPHLIKQRPIGGGKSVSYVEIGNVIDRLNRACDQWNWTTTKIEVHVLPILRGPEGNKKLIDTPVVHVTGVLQIPGLGMRGAVGTAPAENNEDPAKIAESDAIKRAATMFGVPGGR